MFFQKFETFVRETNCYRDLMKRRAKDGDPNQSLNRECRIIAFDKWNEESLERTSEEVKRCCSAINALCEAECSCKSL